jgi:hypothetical protein
MLGGLVAETNLVMSNLDIGQLKTSNDEMPTSTRALQANPGKCLFTASTLFI